MIVLDTNVISEAMRGPGADPAVRAWLLSLSGPPVTTVISRAEIAAGLRLLPDGRRKAAMSAVAASVFAGFDVCLPLTPECAEHYGDIVASRSRAGRPIGGMDALIAAIVRECNATLATRDLGDFDGLDLDLLDPWRF